MAYRAANRHSAIHGCKRQKMTVTVVRAYRSRAVNDPRGVLREFGLELVEDVKIRVWDDSGKSRGSADDHRPHLRQNCSQNRAFEGDGFKACSEYSDLLRPRLFDALAAAFFWGWISAQREQSNRLATTLAEAPQIGPWVAAHGGWATFYPTPARRLSGCPSTLHSRSSRTAP
jgi:nitrile hydratase alpha subunit